MRRQRQVTHRRRYRLPTFNRWSCRSSRADVRDTLANPIVKEGRGAPQPVRNAAVSRGAGSAGVARNSGLPYFVSLGLSGLSHCISLSSGARIYLGMKFCGICKVHVKRLKHVGLALNFEVLAQIPCFLIQ